MAENFLRGAARVDFAEGKTAEKPLKSPKNVKKRENFIFLSCSKFSLYFFTPRGIKIKKLKRVGKSAKSPGNYTYTYPIKSTGLDNLSIIFDPKTNMPPPTTSPAPIKTPTSPTVEMEFSNAFEFPIAVG